MLKSKKSSHRDFEFILFLSWTKSPITLNVVSIKISFIQDNMSADVLFDKSDCCSVVIETSFENKLSNFVLATSLHVSLRYRIDVEVFEMHFRLLPKLNIISAPLACLRKIRHLSFIIIIKL